ETDAREAQSVEHDVALNAAGAGSERHADADFLRLPRDGVRDDAVDAERGEQQAECGEDGHEQHEETAWRIGSIDDGTDGTKFGGGLLGVQLAQSQKNASRKRGGR